MASPASPLARLLRPSSIAVVGGGPWCEAVLARCRAMGFAGDVHAVHPRRDTIGGFRAWPDVDALPAAPDATFVGVNRDASIDVVAALAARFRRDGRDAGGAVCFANGFAEAGEAGRQRALLDAAGDVALLGPNCYGYLNALDGVALWPDQHGCVRVERGVALITQSSNLALNLTMQRRGLPLAYVVTSGNQAQQGFAAIGTVLLDDLRVTALGLHVEGFGDVRAFERLAAHAAGLGKPVVVLKSGRSAAARPATLSHTASLAGSDAGADALLRRLGVARVDSLPVLLETLKLLHVHGAIPVSTRASPPPSAFGARDSRRTRTVHLASLSCSGGEASLIADAARAANRGVGLPRLVFPELDAPTRRTLADALGPRVALANPLDYDTGIWRDVEALERVYTAATGDDIDLTLLVLDLPREDRCGTDDWDAPIAALERAARASGRRLALVASLPENLPETLARRLLDAGVAPMAGIDDALSAIRAAAAIDGTAPSGHEPVLLVGDGGATAEQVSAARVETGTTTAIEAGAAIEPDPEAGLDVDATTTVPRTLTEHAAKLALAAHGLDVPRGGRATDVGTAGTVAATIGFPVVLKGEGFAHKSDAGAVALGLADPDAVVRAAQAMPGDAYLVEQMIGGALVELLVGVVHDPAHGFVLTLGAGGVLTELLGDRVSRLLPVTAEEIGSALAELRVSAVIDGVRGRPRADRAALVRAVLAVQSYVLAHADHVVELEINPLLGTRDSAVALDALLVLRR